LTELSESHGFFGVHYLTVAQVAACLNVSKMTIYRLVHSGEMPAARFGHSVRVSEGDMEDYVHRAAAAAPVEDRPTAHRQAASFHQGSSTETGATVGLN
jgi:excisionase family DNA binding protein